MNKKKFYVYIVTNLNNTVLYTGVTNNLKERIIEHYTGKESSKSFTSKYHCYYLLLYEGYDYVNNAIAREKEIKGWVRKRKLELIRSFNPEFKFLNEELFGEWPPREIASRLK
jgi:putative endonuclease